MEAQPNTSTIATVIAKMRSAVRLPPLLPAHDVFERLLGNLLLRGSTDPGADIQRFLHELATPEIQECARTYVYEHEFGHIVATVAHYGPGPVDADMVGPLWPTADRAEAEAVAQMVQHVQAALPVLALSPGGEGLRQHLITAGVGWDVTEGSQPPPRSRGRPADPIQKSALVLGVREDIFRDGAQPYAEVAASLATVYAGRANQKSIYRRMKGIREEMPIPKGWHDTLLRERISPLHADLFSTPEGASEVDPPLVTNWKAGRWPRAPR
ncbi:MULTISPECIES: hypothetical protein [Sorangium]|uniref:hypothetical protein n=1 Tax=Sorangium TaxID=39643 RepID=UPI003D9C3DFC